MNELSASLKRMMGTLKQIMEGEGMEEMNNKLKIFIAYSHNDEKPFIDEFKKHLAPLKDKGLVEEWYDRKVLPGEDYQSEINYNLENGDIICLFISASFLDSPNCKKEKKKAIGFSPYL